MLTVNIYKLQNDGSQKSIVTCRLKDNTVECSGDQTFIENLQKKGITVMNEQGSHQKFFPADGLLFLRNLQRAFSSGYLMATEVQDE